MAKILERALEVLLILGILYLAGCHTVHGVGHDLMDWSSKYVERD